LYFTGEPGKHTAAPRRFSLDAGVFIVIPTLLICTANIGPPLMK
jgi:hypothetical protein